MLYPITGKIQHYAWGGFDYLPHLLHIENNLHQPFAEYWLGAHPKAPSDIKRAADTETLDRLIAAEPEKYLGKPTADRFGRLPYLFKILDVHDMLSIQVHPSKAEAEKGFARENASGIPLDAAERNYKDDNHKPEMMVALSPFYLLHGFMPADRLKKQLAGIPELSALVTTFEQQGYKGLYSKVMNMAQQEVNTLLAPLLQRIVPLYEQGQLDREQPDFWAARTLVSGMTDLQSLDRGIFSIYLFNLLRLQPGEGIFQAAGVPHAYLEGQNIELMANSDNVLRGGLTPKHVDVDELLKHIAFEGVEPHLLKKAAGELRSRFPCPVPDFALEQITLEAEQQVPFQTASLEIALMIQGTATFTGSVAVERSAGTALMISAGEHITVTAKAPALLFKAGVPLD